MLLAGDIGGTKTLLAVYASSEKFRRPLAERRYASDDYHSLEAILTEFLNETRLPVTHAVFGIAGPVVNGVVETTNLPWIVDEHKLAQVFGLQGVKLLNDLEAVALAVPTLEQEDLAVLNPGRPVPGGTIGVIAPGTGLGEAFLVWDGRQYRAYPSEGGHTDFGPHGELQWELLRYMQQVVGKKHVSYEHVCSGIGIPNIYRFLLHIGYAEEPEWLAQQLAGAEDLTPIIVQAAHREPDPVPLCRKTLEIFITILGAEAGNLALKVLATSGIYVGGGIPPRILPELRTGRFMEAFTNKGRFRDLMEEIPVHVILNSQAALLGATNYGIHLMGGGS